MKPIRVVVTFLALFLVVMVGLSVAFRWIGPAYLAGYRLVGNIVIPGMGPNCDVRFEFLPEDSQYRDRYRDTKLVLQHKITRVKRTKVLGARVTGYVPTVMLIALIVATPLPWRRRGRALLWGVAIMQGIVILRTALLVLYVVSHDETLQAMKLGPTADYLVVSAFNAFVRSTLSSYVLATLVWIGVCLRKSGWDAFTRSLSTSRAA